MPPDTAASNDNGNGRVTLALLGQKVDRLHSDVQAYIEETRKHREAVEQRLRDIERNQAIEKERVNASKLEEQCLRSDVEKLQEQAEKTTWWNGMNTALATIGSVLAGLIGTKQ